MNRTTSFTHVLRGDHRRLLLRKRHRSFSAGDIAINGLLERLRKRNENDIHALPEYRARSNLHNSLLAAAADDGDGGDSCDVNLKSSHASRKPISPPCPPPGGYTHVLSGGQIRTVLDASMATFHLHVESRIAALCGHGYYTIGPCGEGRLGKRMDS